MGGEGGETAESRAGSAVNIHVTTLAEEWITGALTQQVESYNNAYVYIYMYMYIYMNIYVYI
jgi:hypothetical protein